MVEITRNMVCKIIAVNAEFDICFCFILRLTDSWGEFEFEGSRHFLIPLLRLHLPAFEVGHRIQLLKVFFFHIFYYCWRFVQRWRLLVLSLFAGMWVANWWTGVNTRLELANGISFQFQTYDFLSNHYYILKSIWTTVLFGINSIK